MTVERIHPKAPVMLIFIAIFTCLPSCINLSNIIRLIFYSRICVFLEVKQEYFLIYLCFCTDYSELLFHLQLILLEYITEVDNASFEVRILLRVYSKN